MGREKGGEKVRECKDTGGENRDGRRIEKRGEKRSRERRRVGVGEK